MKMALSEVGREKTRLMIIDNFSPDPAAIIDMAAAMAPFPRIDKNYYPGVRRFIARDEPAHGYVASVCNTVIPLMEKAFGVRRFQVKEASFSMVTQLPETTQLIQRVPHFDTLDAGDFAILHYLSPVEQGGTGFYRHRRTGFERLSPTRYNTYLSALDEDLKAYGAPKPAYISQSTDAFERIEHCAGVFNRLVVYQGSLLHCADVGADFSFDPDPRRGRLTGNIFIHALS